MNFDSLTYPYASRRTVVYANRGMVATSHPLAAEAGLSVLRRGGNAVDAAIATAAALTVVEPTSNGIGGDAFALIHTPSGLFGLNASGRAPQALSLDALIERGIAAMPTHGWIPVTVPGAPSAWAEAVERFGSLPLTDVLQPAITLAADGYPVAPTVAYYWRTAYNRYKELLDGEMFKPWFDTFAPDGKTPAAGEIVRLPDHARTLTAIAQSNARDFYEGALAEQIERFSRIYGGFIGKTDLAAHTPEWVEPISVSYRGYQVWEIPPNGQGIVALMALNLMNGFTFHERERWQTYHQQIESIKTAFSDGLEYVSDPLGMKVSTAELLSESYAAIRRQTITDEALNPRPGTLPQSGTVYLATADGNGNMVSFIQSNYMGFGSGIVIPGTGIALQNRGHTFSLNPSHVNALHPGKRTYHTIIPGFLTKDGHPVGPFGVMGGFMQPQGHVQLISNLIDFHMNPQAALDAPRWQWVEDRKVLLERSVPSYIAEQLAQRGHQVEIANGSGAFGRGQVIIRLANGVLAAGTEPRADGHIAAW